MDMSEKAINLIRAIKEYCNESIKTKYVFTEEEQAQLEYNMQLLNNTINVLANYEIKRKK